MIVSRNESKVCNAVVKCLEVLTGKARREVRFPDKETAGDGKVDMIVKLGREEYAIEHTRLEAFEGEIKAVGVEIEQVCHVLKARLGDGIPGPSYYSVNFVADFCLPGGMKERRQALEEIVEWVRKAIEVLHERKVCRQGSREQPHVGADWIKRCQRGNGFNFEMSVVRWPFAEAAGFKPGSLLVGPVVKPGALSRWEEMGKERVRRAYRRKVPKLLERKGAGARTVLAFESENVREDVARGEVGRLAAEERNALDEVYVVERIHAGWLVVTIKRGDKYQLKEFGSVSWHHIYEVGRLDGVDISERTGLPKRYIRAMGLEEILHGMFPSCWDGWSPALACEQDVCD